MTIGKKRASRARNAAPSGQGREEAPAAGQDAAVCPACGGRADAGSLFCPRCGLNLEAHGRAAERRAGRKRKVEKEIKRLAGEGAVRCTNELAGFEAMYRSGLCESVEGVFSRTLQFSDISYEHERKDVKDDIFDKWCDIHALATPGTCYQINLVNFPTASYDAERYLPEEGANADLAAAYNDILEERQRRGRLEFDRPNFYTFAVEASDDDEAERLLGPIMQSAISQFKRLQSTAEELDGDARMRVMHSLVRGRHEPFTFDYAQLERSRTARARDFVAPGWAAYAEQDKNLRAALTLPGRYVKVFHIKDFGSDLSDRAIRTIRALPIPMSISLSYRKQPRGKIVRKIRENINAVQAEIFSYQAGVSKSGGDFTHLPPAMEEREADSLELLDFVREEDQDVSWFQGLVCVFAESPERMKVYEQMLMNEKETWSIDLVALPAQQEEAFVSSLPLATPRLDKKYRSLAEAEGAALIPFSSQNIHDDPKKSLLLGVDTVSGDSLLVDPDKLKSPHGWLFGITGAGKGVEVNSFVSYALLQHPRTAFNESTRRMENPDPRCPQWHVLDFHDEYEELGIRFAASIGKFGPGQPSCLNPMALADSTGALTMKEVVKNTDFFLALSESIMDRPLTQREKSLLDRFLSETFKPHIGKPTRPTLKDFYDAMKASKDELIDELAGSYEIFVEGSLNSFSGQTNYETNPQLNIYGMAEVGANMQTLAILSVFQHVRHCTFENYQIGKPTYLLLEEVQILFDNDAAVRILDAYFGELRKYGLHIICVTQIPGRVLDHPRASYLFENSGWFVFLPQQVENADRISKMFRLSDSQRERILPSAEAGTGIVIADGVKVAMSNRIPKGNPLYKIWNTDPYKMAGADEGEVSALAAELGVDAARLRDAFERYRLALDGPSGDGTRVA